QTELLVVTSTAFPTVSPKSSAKLASSQHPKNEQRLAGCADDPYTIEKRSRLRDHTSSDSCARTAARSSLASCSGSAVSCSPRGKPLLTFMGIEIAGVPKAVHGAFILGSPVDASPCGAGPVAAGTKITGVVLYISAIRDLHSSMYRLASSYRSTEIW